MEVVGVREVGTRIRFHSVVGADRCQSVMSRLLSLGEIALLVSEELALSLAVALDRVPVVGEAASHAGQDEGESSTGAATMIFVR